MSKRKRTNLKQYIKIKKLKEVVKTVNVIANIFHGFSSSLNDLSDKITDLKQSLTKKL